MTSTLAFHGAARTVTGSKYLPETAGERTLIDAGLFQGLKELRLLNWEEPPFRPHRLDRTLLTHPHIDHIGFLPRLVLLHHLVRLLPRRGNLVLMAGFQAAGTRGRKLLEGRRTLRVHGADIPVRAECVALHGLSAHGDRGELERWMTAAGARPGTVYVTHREPEAALAFARRLESQRGPTTHVPRLGDVVEL